MCHLCDDSGNLISLILVYVHADGAECLLMLLLVLFIGILYMILIMST